ncbi:MAG: TonB family protein [Bacteroidota bacterium]|nr:TonB family protein [Bacteroidota bacterium]
MKTFSAILCLLICVSPQIYPQPSPGIDSTAVAYQMTETQSQQNETEGKIYGTVIDAGTQMPIRLAVVEILGTELKDTTSFDGQYRILHVPTGYYQMRASAGGYVPQIENNVFIHPGSGLTRFFVLKNSPDVPPDYVPVEKQPVPTNTPAPKYPESARKESIEGVIWVKLIVKEDGTVGDVVVLKSAFSGQTKVTVSQRQQLKAQNDLQEATKEAAKQWRFTPAMLNGKPTKVWVTIPFKFKLESSKGEKKSH